MAERIVSPGVFTQERDLSFLEQGISEIGGAFIGPTPKGPAFIPTIVESQQQFENIFGTPDNKSFLGLTVKNYLRESGRATVVRVLGLDGYDAAVNKSAILFASGSSGSFVYAVIHPTTSGSTLTSITATGPATNFSLQLGAVSSSGLSTTTTAASFVGKYLGFGPDGNNTGYIYSVFPEAVTAAGAAVSMSAVTSSAALNLSGSVFGTYTNASTPYIQSQTLGGQKLNLFKIHTLSDGNAANNDVKVSILGPKKGQFDGDWGTFTLIVRDATDTDQRAVVLEQYDNLTMDPDSPNYIARRIGNSAPYDDTITGERYFQGEFRNTSIYIRVEMAPGANDVPTDAVPFGFAPLSNSFEFYGFTYSDSLNTNMSYLAPLPSGSTTLGAATAFSLENLPANELYLPDGITPVLSTAFSGSVTNDLKFTVPFQGGFDGDNPARNINMYEAITDTNTQGFNCQTGVSDGSRAYKKALDNIANPDVYDINLLVLPGIVYELHPYVANYALNICESRGDCFYILDLAQASSTITSAVNQAALLDTSYAAGYFPWIRVLDDNTNKLVFVPPSVSLPEVYAYNDNVAAEWFAPAGLNRGGIPGAAGVRTRLAQAQRDELYEGKVNPIAQFPGQGICVWGQKTLQRRASALDRINVRRLLIAVKKFIASSARCRVFEQNVEATRRRFLNIANPYLANVQERSGLYAFRVIMDETNNTPDVIDRNILVGQLYLQPTKTAEFIKLEFNILPTGAVFPGA